MQTKMDLHTAALSITVKNLKKSEYASIDECIIGVYPCQGKQNMPSQNMPLWCEDFLNLLQEVGRGGGSGERDLR